eukprot:9764952-Lingulodinium_polyedra.AAC.1
MAQSPGRALSCEQIPTSSTAARRPRRKALEVTSPGLCLSSPGVASSLVVVGSTARAKAYSWRVTT